MLTIDNDPVTNIDDVKDRTDHDHDPGEGALSARDELARARPLSEILAELAAMARQGAAVRVPIVTAHLAQGAAIHGELVDAVSGPGGLHLCPEAG